MRHEPKLMTPGPVRQRGPLQFRTLKCDECGIVGGESTRNIFGGPTQLCYGFDDDTGRPCRPITPPQPEADTPVILEPKQ